MPEPTLNYNVSRLHLETDERGWIAGTSRAGIDVAYNAVGSWVDILQSEDTENRGIQSIEVEHSLSLDNRALIRPESPNMTVVLNTPDRMDNMYNKNIRLTYDHPTLGTKTIFTGRVIDADTSIGIESIGDSQRKVYQTTLQCASVVTTQLVNTTLFNFTAPQEDVLDRIARINVATGLNVDADVTGVSMAACSGVNISVFDALMDCAIASYGIFFVALDGTVFIKAPEVTPAVIYNFGDITGADHEYSNLDFAYGVDDIVSSVVATAKSDSTKFRTKTVGGAAAVNQENVTVDVIASNVSLDAWLAGFPFKYAVTLVPKSADVKYYEDLAFVSPILGANILHEGVHYDLAIKSVRHSIGKKWRIKLEFMDVNIITHQTVPATYIKPSPPRNFNASAGPVSGGTYNATLTWKLPSAPGSISGYEIRWTIPTHKWEDAPTKTSGSVLTTLGKNATSYVHTGRTAGVNYNYSIFAITDNVAVYSDRATIGLAGG